MVSLHPARIQTPQAMIELARKGDAAAFGQLYELWVNPIYRFIYLKTKDEHVAEDITAEVFLKCWKGLKSFRSREAKFSTWLFAIARNAVIDYYRTSKQTTSLENLPEIADLTPEMDLYPEQTQLRVALNRLKPEYRQVLELRYVEDVPIPKVAQIMKKKEGNVRALTNRALTALKQELS